MNLRRFESKNYSQNGEDGIIRAITEFFDIPHNFVEIGVGDGMQNNTRTLAVDGWNGIWIDQVTSINVPANIAYRQAHVTRDNICQLLEAAYRWQPDFGLLSLDIDGNDYHVLQAILEGGYRPHMLVLEYNPRFEADEHWVMPYDPNHAWDCTFYYGASFRALARLCDMHGYMPLGADSTGTNMFLVRKPTIADTYVPMDRFLYRNHQETPRITGVVKVREELT